MVICEWGDNNHFRSLGFLKVSHDLGHSYDKHWEPPHIICQYSLVSGWRCLFWRPFGSGGAAIVRGTEYQYMRGSKPWYLYNVWQVGFTSSQLGVGVIMVIMEKKPTWPILIWWADFKQLRFLPKKWLYGAIPLLYLYIPLFLSNTIPCLCLPFS